MYPHNAFRPRAERRFERENVVFITDEPQRFTVMSGRRREVWAAVIYMLAGAGVITLIRVLSDSIERLR